MNLKKINITVTERDKKILVIGGIFLIFALVFYGIYGQYQELSEAMNELEEEIKQLELKEEDLSYLREIKEKEEKLVQKYEVLGNALPDSPQQSNLIRQIRQSVIHSGKLRDINFAAVEINDNYNEQPIHIIYQGRYSGLVDFLEGLGKASRAFRIDGVEIYEGEKGLPQIMADVYISAFYR